MNITRTCPQCQEKADITDWLPEREYDPRLRQFKCHLFGHIFYKLVPIHLASQHKAAVKK